MKKAPKTLSDQEETASETRSGSIYVNGSRETGTPDPVLEEKNRLREIFSRREGVFRNLCAGKNPP